MRALSWILKLLLFLLLLGFALKNTTPVEVRFFLGQVWQAPLSLVIFLSFVAGAVLGVAAALGLAYRQRRELRRLRRDRDLPPQAGGDPQVPAV